MSRRTDSGAGDAAQRLRDIVENPAMSAATKARAAMTLSIELFPSGDRQVMLDAIFAAAELFREIGDPRGKDEVAALIGCQLAALAESAVKHHIPCMASLGHQLYDWAGHVDDPAMARYLLTTARDVYAAHGDTKGEADVLCQLCSLDLAGPDLERMATRALQIYQSLGDDQGRLFALHLVAQAAHHAGRIAAARSYRRKALRLARKRGDADAEASTLMALAVSAAQANKFARERRLLLRAATLIPKLEDPAVGALVLSMLGTAEEVLGRPDRARDYYARAQDAHRSSGFVEGAARAHEAMADLHSRHSRPRDAAREAVEAVRNLELKRQRILSAGSRARWYQEHRHTYVRALELAALAGDGPSALEVIDAGRAEALAAALGADPDELASGVRDPDEMGKLVDRIAHIEDAGPNPIRPDDAPSPEHAAMWNAFGAFVLEEDHTRLANLAGTGLLRSFSGGRTDLGTLRAALGPRTHTVLHDIEWNGDAATVFSVWVPPLPGEPVIERFALSPTQAGWVRAFAERGEEFRALLDEHHHPWQDELAGLIPEGCRAVLGADELVPTSRPSSSSCRPARCGRCRSPPCASDPSCSSSGPRSSCHPRCPSRPPRRLGRRPRPAHGRVARRRAARHRIRARRLAGALHAH